MKIRYLFSCFVLLLIKSNACATEQVMDMLILNDSVFYIFSENLISDRPIRGYPLEHFIWTKSKDSIQENAKNEMLKPYRWCMRGYIAKWEIRNDSLFLTEIFYKPIMVTAFVQGNPNESFPLQKLFPDRDVTNGVFADWFRGFINTVTEHVPYPPLSDDKWTGKRKRIMIRDGMVLAIRES